MKTTVAAATMAITLASAGAAHAQFTLTLPKPLRNTPADPNTWKIPSNQVRFVSNNPDYTPPGKEFLAGCGAKLTLENGRQWLLTYDSGENGVVKTAKFWYEGQYRKRGEPGAMWVFKYNGQGEPPHKINIVSITSWGQVHNGQRFDEYPYALSKYYQTKGDSQGVFHEGWWGKWK